MKTIKEMKENHLMNLNTLMVQKDMKDMKIMKNIKKIPLTPLTILITLTPLMVKKKVEASLMIKVEVKIKKLTCQFPEPVRNPCLLLFLQNV